VPRFFAPGATSPIEDGNSAIESNRIIAPVSFYEETRHARTDCDVVAVVVVVATSAAAPASRRRRIERAAATYAAPRDGASLDQRS